MPKGRGLLQALVWICEIDFRVSTEYREDKVFFRKITDSGTSMTPL